MLYDLHYYSIQVFDFLFKGGLLMGPIMIISIISVTLCIERIWYFRRVRCDVRKVYAEVERSVSERHFDEAASFCKQHGGTVVPGALYCVLKNRQRSVEDIEKLVSVYGTRAIQDLSRHVRFLGTLGNITPLIGLLGTVVGMVKTFMTVAEHSGHVNPGILAGGIWEALLTTAAGLTVAIPTVVMYHHFENQIDSFAFQIKNYSLELIELLSDYD